MLFRDEMSERISAARTVTEGKDLLTLPESCRHSRDGKIVKSNDNCLLPFIRSTPCHSEERSEEESLTRKPLICHSGALAREQGKALRHYERMRVWNLKNTQHKVKAMKHTEEKKTYIRMHRQYLPFAYGGNFA